MNTLVPLTPTIKWTDNKIKIIDQTKLPLEEEYIETDDYKKICDAIYNLSIRGAPAIGVAGAYACVLAANKIKTDNLNGVKFSYKSDNEIVALYVRKKHKIDEIITKVKNAGIEIYDISTDEGDLEDVFIDVTKS